MQKKPLWALSRKARSDLENIWLYGVEKWSLRQAESYVADLFDIFREISEFPKIGRDASSLRKGFRRHEHGSHVIFYTVKAKSVFIVRILHERMDPSQHV